MAAAGNAREVPRKVKNRAALGPGTPASENVIAISESLLHPEVRCSIIHNTETGRRPLWCVTGGTASPKIPMWVSSLIGRRNVTVLGGRVLKEVIKSQRGR